MDFFKKGQFAAIIGNTIEYYDQALYGYLALWIAPLFFPTQDLITSLILTYLLLPLGFIARPVGAYFIGKIGDRVGRKKALIISIIGMGGVTGLIGCLPTYQDIGLFAPLFLVMCRVLQTFFVGAEFNGGAIYVLEHTAPNKQGLASGLYSSGSVLGFLAASIMVWIISRYPSLSWRVPFYISFITAVIGWILRGYMPEIPLNKPILFLKFTEFFRKHGSSFLCLVGISGLFNTLYTIPTIFFNSYIPLISTIPVEKVMAASNIGLGVYIVSLIFFGYLSDKLSCFRVMMGGAISALVFSCPLFLCLQGATFQSILFVKISFAIIAGACNGGFHALVLEIFDKSYRYRGISVSYSLGSQLIGGSTPAICLWIWRYFDSITAPVYWLLFCVVLGIMSLRKLSLDKSIAGR
jgi:MHS family proline/betaine transporter-like MFS transporter